MNWESHFFSLKKTKQRIGSLIHPGQGYTKEILSKITCNLPNVDHANPNMTTMNLTANKASVCLVIKISRQAVSAMSKGRMQYPSTQTLWKNDL